MGVGEDADPYWNTWLPDSIEHRFSEFMFNLRKMSFAWDLYSLSSISTYHPQSFTGAVEEKVKPVRSKKVRSEALETTEAVSVVYTVPVRRRWKQPAAALIIKKVEGDHRHG